MQQKIYELISIPIMSGVVGYVTNALAIKMLFRPFMARWYTFGWQGIIPRTRTDLAKNVAKLVAEKLVTVEEIDKTISSPEIKVKIENVIQRLIQSTTTDDEKVATVSLSVKELLNDPHIANSVNAAAAELLNRAVGKILQLNRGQLAKFLSPLQKLDRSAPRANLNLLLEMSLKDAINNVVYSGRSLSDLSPLPINTSKIADMLTNKVNIILQDVLKNPHVADVLADYIVEYKESTFKSGLAGKMTLGLINTFFYNEKIHEVVHEKLPDAGEKIAKDEKAQELIQFECKKRVDYLAYTPIATLIKEIPAATYFSILQSSAHSVIQKTLPADILGKLMEFIKGDDTESAETLELFLSRSGVATSTFLPQTLPLSEYLLSSSDGGVLKRIFISDEHSVGVAKVCSAWVIDILKKSLPLMLATVNIGKIVEDKINSLDLAEVEDMLFSFMKHHFKWINILGFVIGFIVGVFQVVVIIFSEFFQ